MENWRRCWRDGFVPDLSLPALRALRDALSVNDERLIQGQTTNPLPAMAHQGSPVGAACALGYCGWQGDMLETVGDVEEFFANAYFKANMRMNEPAGCRHFLTWYDDTPREEMIRDLLPEVEKAIEERVSHVLNLAPGAGGGDDPFAGAEPGDVVVVQAGGPLLVTAG